MTPGSNIPLPTARVAVDVAAPVRLDVSGLLLTGDGKVRSDDDFIFYNQPRSADGSVTHQGKSGTVDSLEINLAGLPAEIETVAVAASTDGTPIGQASGLHLTVNDGGSELVRFDITDATSETAFVFGVAVMLPRPPAPSRSPPPGTT